MYFSPLIMVQDTHVDGAYHALSIFICLKVLGVPNPCTYCFISNFAAFTKIFCPVN